MSTKNKQKAVVSGAALVFVAILLALPLSNYFVERQKIISKAEDPRFAEVSKILQASCADCHSPGLLVKPLYADLPVAKTLIARDIGKAQAAFVLNEQQLAGLQPINTVDLAKIATTIQEATMPPRQYTLMHWNAVLAPAQRQTILSYIQDRQEEGTAPLSALATQNPFNPDLKKAAIGELLFQDKRLSADNTVSCASCHNLARAGVDNQEFSTAPHGKEATLNTPTVLNCAFNSSQFWDGRSKSLKEQVADSLKDPNQMDVEISKLAGRLNSDTKYSAMVKQTYGSPFNADTICDAIAEYEKTLLTPGAKFDGYLSGDNRALNEEEKRGYELFVEKGCASCHGGVAIGGNSLEKMGTAGDYFAYRKKTLNLTLKPADAGRFDVTAKDSDKGKFKVPGLRNIERTGPYFHDGSIKDLTRAVDIMAQFEVGQKLKPEENAAIVAFLKTLTGRPPGK